MRIEHLSLRAFRGIPGEIELDFRSPITVIFAPNGTGKTSICDAAEWLLTGQVGRMEHRLRRSGEDLRCLFGQESTRVEARITKDETKQKELRRELKEDGSPQLRHRSETGWPQYGGSSALQWLAPLAPRYAPKGKIPAKDARRWLRATYFLEGHSLGLLIDPSDHADETRRLLFARLLGVGELESRAQAFSKLSSRLKPKLNELESKVNDVEDRIERLHLELRAVSAAPAQLRRRAEDGLEQARQLLPADSTTDAALPVQIGELKVVHEAESREAEADAELFEKLKTELPSRDDRRAQVEANERELGGLAKALNEGEKGLDEIRERLGEARQQEREKESRREAAQKLGTETEQTHESLEEDLELLIDHRGPEVLRQKVRVAPLRAEVDGLREELEAEDDERLEKLRKEKQELQRGMADLDSALEDLRAVFRGETLTDSDRCPFCGHAHGSSEALHQAIEATLTQSPEEVQKRSLRLREIELKESQVRRELEDRKELVRERLAAAKEAQAASERLAGIETLLVGFEKRAAVFDAAFAAPLRRATPEAWRRRLEALADFMQGQIEKLNDRLANVQAKIEKLEQQQSDAVSQIEVSRTRHDRLRRDTARKRKELKEIDEIVRRFQLSETVSPEAALVDIEERVDQRRGVLKKADGLLQDADAFLREAQKAEKSSRELEELDGSLKTLWDRRAKLSAWLEDLETSRDRLVQARREYVRTQIEPLNKVISALYRRAQGNAVIDRIGARHADEDEEPLEWQPQIGDEKLEVKQLSLGQRQDLALAIFLARARSLGGTFFLDEPLIHLDDLNRVALLDIMRVLALDRSRDLHLVITTASSYLTSHFREKFSLVDWVDGVPPLQIYELEGGPRMGVSAEVQRVPSRPLR